MSPFISDGGYSFGGCKNDDKYYKSDLKIKYFGNETCMANCRFHLVGKGENIDFKWILNTEDSFVARITGTSCFNHRKTTV